MTIQEALTKLVESEHFKKDAREDAKLRVFLGRFRKGEIKSGAAVEMLMRYGYIIQVKKQNKNA